MRTSKTIARILSAALCVALLLSAASALGETYMTVRGGLLNLRQSASLEAKVLGQYPTGTWVAVAEKGDVWSKVTVAGKDGYMMSKFLSAASAGKTMYVRTNTGIGLNLRSAPNMNGTILGSFKPGTAVTVIKQGSGWYLVKAGDLEGYMSSRFLAGATQSYTKPVTPYSAKLININGGSIVNFRLYPGMKTKVLATYPVGTAVTVLEVGENWSLVDINGAQGYVSTYFLKR